MTKLLEGKIALVTGASRGIGYAIAKTLAGEGAHIIAVAQTIGGLEELDDEIKELGSSATLVPLNLKDYDGIDRMGQSIYDRFGRLDVLVGNAGILGTLSPLGHIDPKVWDDLMAVNVTANWRLIRSFDPLLKQAENARAVFVSSGAAAKSIPYWGGYATSKAALETLIKTYASETSSTNIKVNLLSPGPIATAMRAKAMPGEEPETIPKAISLAKAMLKLCLPEQQASGEIYDFADDKITQR